MPDRAEKAILILALDRPVHRSWPIRDVVKESFKQIEERVREEGHDYGVGLWI